MDIQQRRQEHFNKAYLGVIAQGGPAYRKSNGEGDFGGCMYLAPNGNKCNIGHILSDKELEDFGDFIGGVHDLWAQMRLDYDHPFYLDRLFYDSLQEVHDNLIDFNGEKFIHLFKKDMMDFALAYDLQLPKVGDETATA